MPRTRRPARSWPVGDSPSATGHRCRSTSTVPPSAKNSSAVRSSGVARTRQPRDVSRTRRSGVSAGSSTPSTCDRGPAARLRACSSVIRSATRAGSWCALRPRYARNWSTSSPTASAGQCRRAAARSARARSRAASNTGPAVAAPSSSSAEASSGTAPRPPSASCPPRSNRTTSSTRPRSSASRNAHTASTVHWSRAAAAASVCAYPSSPGTRNRTVHDGSSAVATGSAAVGRRSRTGTPDARSRRAAVSTRSPSSSRNRSSPMSPGDHGVKAASPPCCRW